MKAVVMSVAVMALVCVVSADVVHVFEQTEAGGTTVQIADRMLDTGRNYKTGAAPEMSGWVFTHWTISTAQDFADRDAWGRAYDEAPFKLYEETTLTAHYLPATQDEDGDGMADGYEIYWYGDLGQGATSDTDGDGLTFAEEVAGGTNPLMADADIDGPVRVADGMLILYNPNNYGAVTLRSDPEGALFATVSEVYRPGTKVATTTEGTFDPNATVFAYWSFNGVRQADAWGRALDSTEVLTDGQPLEIVAVTAENKEQRMKLYWYGTTEVAMDSDTDGDGLTFAQELAGGTNPLMADADIEGPVRFADGAQLQYNPWNLQPYTIRSEPEGALFETVTDYARAGSALSSAQVGTLGATTAGFAYWKLNGVAQRDGWGRAIDQLDLRMPTNAVELVAIVVDDEEARQKIYWYGTTDVALDSDTDGDGVSFADELARGTSPLMADADIEGPVKYADSQLHEANLQPYEQVTGTVVDEKYEVFPTFEGAVTPTFADVDGDGTLDIVVEVAGGETVVYLGCGNEGNPEFTKVAWQAAWDSALAAAKPRALEGLEFDVNPPADTLSWSFADVDGDGVEDLLVSDSDGRIWFYKGNQSIEQSEQSNNSFVLQHKVWGGSFAGFAEGLRIATVDWDGDGDVDCLCGTDEGKLMLLRDPKIGRPTNLKALAGVDNVRLFWDPNQQSRIRGYRVYRKDANDGTDEEAEWTPLSYNSLQSFTTPLPSYRDYPPSVSDFDYAVSSVSRRYVTGSSTPIVSESPKTEAVRASLGKVKFLWSDAAAFVGDEVQVKLGVENSLNLSGNGLALTVAYDAATMQPVRIETSGLTENVTLTDSAADGRWTVSASGGEIAAGGGTFVSFVFRGLQAATGEVAFVSATLKSVGGATVTPVQPEKNARVEIWARQPETPIDPRYVGPYGKWDLDGDGWLTWEDRQLMARLMQGGPNKKYTADQLRAGDDNGNGELDNHDFQQMKADFDELGIKNN